MTYIYIYISPVCGLPFHCRNSVTFWKERFRSTVAASPYVKCMPAKTENWEQRRLCFSLYFLYYFLSILNLFFQMCFPELLFFSSHPHHTDNTKCKRNAVVQPGENASLFVTTACVNVKKEKVMLAANLLPIIAPKQLSPGTSAPSLRAAPQMQGSSFLLEAQPQILSFSTSTSPPLLSSPTSGSAKSTS